MSINKQGMVVYAYTPNFSGSTGRRIRVQGWPWAKSEMLSEKYPKGKKTLYSSPSTTKLKKGPCSCCITTLVQSTVPNEL
jgi:hypothetical protein